MKSWTAIGVAMVMTGALASGCAGEMQPACEGATCDEGASGASEDVGTAEQAYTYYYGNYDVGVLMGTTGTCPNGNFFQIHMDDEDSGNTDKAVDWIGASVNNGNTTFAFCRVDGTKFHPLASSQHYAVLRLGGACPAGSVEFIRHFDNEDSGNANWFSPSNSDIFPNVVTTAGNGYTDLHFCMFRSGGTTMATFPTLGFSYGVFAPPTITFSAVKGSIHTDDEDDDNRDAYTAINVSIDATEIVTDGHDTTLYVAKVH